MPGDILVEQGRFEIGGRRERLVKLQHIVADIAVRVRVILPSPAIGSEAERSSFSSAITFLIDASMSSIEGSRDAMARDIAY